jgi:hypothetical protein
MHDLDGSTLAVIIAAIALALNFGQRIFGGGWNLQKNLAAMELRLVETIANFRKEMEEEHEKTTHDFGETIAALREHVRQVEFHLRDHYIRKDDFVVMMKSHDDLLRSNFENLNSRLKRIEERLDSKA